MLRILIPDPLMENVPVAILIKRVIFSFAIGSMVPDFELSNVVLFQARHTPTPLQAPLLKAA